MNHTLTISELIPQRPPFQFVDELLTTDGAVTRTSYIVPANGLLQEQGCLLAGGLLENMAQTAAARLGSSTFPHVRLGVIGAVKNFIVRSLPAVETQLLTQVTEVLQYQDMSVLEAQVLVQEEVIASCQLNVVLL